MKVLQIISLVFVLFFLFVATCQAYTLDEWQEQSIQTVKALIRDEIVLFRDIKYGNETITYALTNNKQYAIVLHDLLFWQFKQRVQYDTSIDNIFEELENFPIMRYVDQKLERGMRQVGQAVAMTITNNDELVITIYGADGNFRQRSIKIEVTDMNERQFNESHKGETLQEWYK